MTAFAFNETVPAEVFSTALGTGSGNQFTTNDVGKVVKLGTAQNYVLASGGNEIEGFVTSVEPFTVNGGYTFGGVTDEGFKEVVVGANQGATPMAVGDWVVADTQTALGTAAAGAVKTGTPTKFLWRCVRIISGTGAAGSAVLVQRVD